MGRIHGGWKRIVFVGLWASAGLCAGCSHHRVARPSGPPVEKREQTPTISTDPNSVAPGRTIPAAGLGVDLT